MNKRLPIPLEKAIGKRIVSLALVCCLSAMAWAERTVLQMNNNWAFHRGETAGSQAPSTDDSHWMPATLPHVMQLEKKHCGGGSIYDGVGWYRRYFNLPGKYAGKRVVVEFEGVMKNCEVYLNGHLLTTHHGGYMGFVADLTPHIQWNGTNVLAVRVTAADDPLTPPGKPQAGMDFYYYSGIYRDVRMVITDKVFITDPLQEDVVAGGGQFVTFPKVSRQQAVVHVDTHTRNLTGESRSLTLHATLKDEAGHTVATAITDFTLAAQGTHTVSQDLSVDHPALWHPYTPHLYTLHTRLLQGRRTIDATTQQVGIRTIRYTTDGFFINDEPLYLRGANRHQAYPNVGDAASNSMQERDVISLKQGGYNAVRAAHYPQDPAFLDACDRHGLLVVECIPGWQFFNPDSTFINRLFEVGRQMVRRDRNHPSVVLWETALNESRYPLSLANDIQRIVHAEYPGDQMYTAGDYLGNEDKIDCHDVFYKQVKGYPRDGNVMSNFPEDFIAVKPVLTREWGDGAGFKPRVSLMENEEEQLKQCMSRIVQLCGDGYFDWCMLDANPHMAGHFLWSYNDYARGSQDETMYSGVVDINRYPKPCYYMLQSMRDASVSQPGLYEGPMVHIASHNAGAQYASSTHDITVFSNAEEVRLYRNGRLLGTQTRKERAPLYAPVVARGGSPLYVFDAGNYEAGTLRAEALIGGKVVATHETATPGPAHHLKVTIKTDGIEPLADGSDMVPVFVEVCDEAGTRVYDASSQVTFRVEGEGSLIGDGIPRIAVNPQQTEGGVGFAFVRTTRKAGRITVHAAAEGLQPGKATVRTRRSPQPRLADGTHTAFTGNEEDGVVQKQSLWEKKILAMTPLPIAAVKVGSSHNSYPAENLTDRNDRSWWIAANAQLPHVVTLSLKEPTYVTACRIMFQKDSSSYRHKVETSADGTQWDPLLERECTGWDFKPVGVGRKIQHLRITIEGVSEGLPGMAEVTLF